jgi:hypothetical protein
MDAAAANPNPLVSGNRGVVTNPYITGGAVLPVGRQQRFYIHGGTLDAKVLLQEDPRLQPELIKLIIAGNVRLEETQTREPSEKPLVITGDRVVAESLGATNAAAPAANPQAVDPRTNRSFPPTDSRPDERAAYKITVLGQPALIEGHGLHLSGTNINLDQRANRLWIEGPGSMDLPMPDDFNGQPLAAPSTMNVQWKEGMNFDGLIASFAEDVDASSPGRRLKTKILKIQLQQPINFADPDLQNQKQRKAAFLSCSDGVFLESNLLDEITKQRIAYVRLQVADLNFDLQSGVLTAAGPGWLNSVRPDENNALQNGQGLFLPIGAAAAAPGNAIQPVAQPQPTAPLMATHVRFQGSITGNIDSANQRILFNDRVRVLLAPTDDWSAMLNPDKTEPLGPNEFMLKCDNLAIRNAINPATKANAAEFDAWGNNSVVYGVRSTPREKDVMYTARATRISYNTVKDQLILEGDGRSDVHLYRQLQLGAPPDDTAMKRIIFNKKTNMVFDGVQSLQLNALGK